MEATSTLQATQPQESEWAKEMQELIRELRESQAQTDRQMEKTERQMEKTERQIERTARKVDKVAETVGSWANNHGSFAEEYFFNSFESGKRSFFGEKFDAVEKNVKGIKREARDEYDILLINGKSIGIVEVKYKAHESDVPKVLKKVATFRVNFPDYAHHRVYLGLATLAFYPRLEQLCVDEGVAIIKQVGDTVVINDKHLKAF